MSSASCHELPQDTEKVQNFISDGRYRVHYFAEGSANVVFEIFPIWDTEIAPNNDSSGFPEELQEKLLRLRKDAPGLQNTQQCVEELMTIWEPVFGPQLVLPYYPVYLGEHNRFLQALALATEMNRRSKNNSTNLNTEDRMALVMPNMSKIPEGGVTGSFKLKWLSQSRDAPADATQCRNCALSAYRRSTTPSLCPLWLAEASTSQTYAIDDLFSAMIRKHKATNPQDIDSDEDSLWARFRECFTEGIGFEMVRKVKEFQEIYDTKGFFSTPGSINTSQMLDRAMTLRDCTVFVQVPHDSSKPVEVRLGDLDKKSKDKIPEWAAKERELIDGGFYYQSGPLSNAHCFLARKS
ncbi:MAG: Inositol-pentakisphosphate 2-kinase [Bogoriella megaspora]|nr:MAG: Inositol-pentakisphosphate 2-kinase [Bogoriella megaspora]